MQMTTGANTAGVRQAGMPLIGVCNPSLMDALFPSLTTLQRALFALAAIAVLAVCGKLHFYLPDNPVPITFQTAGVLAMGGFLGLRWGALAIVVYYLLGYVGAPMFANPDLSWDFTRGKDAIQGVTGGYLIGFLTAVPIIGFMSERGWIRAKSLWAMLLGNIWVYVPALIWLSVFNYGWPAEGELFAGAVYPFIPGDLVKLVLAALVLGAGWSIADRRNGARRDTNAPA